MEFLPSIAELWPYLIGIIIAGIVAGFLAGLFGIGGGAVLVPVFYQMLISLKVDTEVCMHVSVGTSLAIIVPTSIRSFLSHKAKGAVDLQLLKQWMFAVPIGVIVASAIAAYVSGAGLRVIFACVALTVAARLLLGRENWQLGTDIPSNPLRSVTGAAIGFLSTFMGIGGGVLNNTFMTLYGRPMHQAIATSSGVGILISIPGLIGYVIAGWGVANLPPFSIGFVNLLMVALVVPLTILVAPYGVRTVHALPRRTVELAFGIFLLLVAMRFFWSAIAS